MNRATVSILSALAVLATSSLSSAATVTTVGADTATDANWRNPAVDKPFDADANNVYGTDGFVVFEYTRANFDWSARNVANDLRWLPSYVTSISDNFAYGYRNDPVYGQINDPNKPLPAPPKWNYPGTVASGNIWDFNTVTITRNGNTGPFQLTVFTCYDDSAKGPEQVWVHSSANPADAVRLDLNYATGKTNYVTFAIGAGTDDVTVRVYSGANHLTGLAFDGLTQRPYTGAYAAMVGKDTSTTANWRNPAVNKPNDADKDNIYGTDGFILYERARINWNWGPRNTGLDVVNLPSYITSVVDDYANGYRSDPDYGAINDPGNALFTEKGAVASGKLWDFNTLTITRTGATGAFWITLFSSYTNTSKNPNQFWVRLGAAGDDIGGSVVPYMSGVTGYATFYIPAGSEDVIVNQYSGANHLTGIAFDGLTPKAFTDEFLDNLEQRPLGQYGDVDYMTTAPDDVTVVAPMVEDTVVFAGANSLQVDFNTGGASSTWASVQVWPQWIGVPVASDGFKFACRAPVGLKFDVSVQDNDWAHAVAPWWGMHHTLDFTQTQNNMWQVFQCKFADFTEPIDPASFTYQLGTIRIYFHGALGSTYVSPGTSGISGSAYFDNFEFVKSTTAVNEWPVY
ncbi:MAG: hypothetical protein WCK47_08455 [bacterium]